MNEVNNAVMETGGKQYYVKPGDVVYVEKLENQVGENIQLPVLAANGAIGKPYLPNTFVDAKVLKHGKQKKIIVYKYKPKKKERNKQGHRQPYTKIEILDIKTK